MYGLYLCLCSCVGIVLWFCDLLLLRWGGEREREAYERIRVEEEKIVGGGGFPRWNNSHPNWEHLALTDSVEKDGTSYNTVHISSSLSFLIQNPNRIYLHLSLSLFYDSPFLTILSQPLALYRFLLLQFIQLILFNIKTGSVRPTAVILFGFKTPSFPLPQQTVLSVRVISQRPQYFCTATSHTQSMRQTTLIALRILLTRTSRY
jgi:hypothetical protein